MFSCHHFTIFHSHLVLSSLVFDVILSHKVFIWLAKLVFLSISAVYCCLSWLNFKANSSLKDESSAYSCLKHSMELQLEYLALSPGMMPFEPESLLFTSSMYLSARLFSAAINVTSFWTSSVWYVAFLFVSS